MRLVERVVQNNLNQLKHELSMFKSNKEFTEKKLEEINVNIARIEADIAESEQFLGLCEGVDRSND
jgi:cob(I)alamin adenosyltransferase